MSVSLIQSARASSSVGWTVTRMRSLGRPRPRSGSVTNSQASGMARSLKYAPVGVKLPIISKNVWWRSVRPTFSRSTVRRHFWAEARRGAGGWRRPW